MAFHQVGSAREDIKYVTSLVTLDDYCHFLNKVATTDLYHLYDPEMQYALPMIKRYGHPGAYHYSILGGTTAAITYVNKISQARFCNWKENGGGDANTETGVYDLTSITNGGDALAFQFLPTPNAHYRLSSNNALSNVDPMLGLGSSGANFVIDCVDSSDAMIENKGIPFSIGNSLSTIESPENNRAIIPLLGGSPLLMDSPDNSSTSGNDALPVIIKNTKPIKIELATIDDPGNQHDQLQWGGLGSVSNVFQIGVTDVTAQQYCAFLKAVATNNDRYELYDTNMGSDSNIACITRIGETNPYDYEVIPGREKFPITYISGVRAASFCNWIENGQPLGEEGPGTTQTGAFDIIYTTNDIYKTITNPPIKSFNGTLSEGTVTTIKTGRAISITVIANVGARWSLPTESQWYKAAYYQKATVDWDGFPGTNQCYYKYGTGTDELPTNSIELATRNNNDANFCLDGHYTQSNAPYITPVGFFKKTKSPFGLYDMSGNVDQWTLFRNATIEIEGSVKPRWDFALRGGSWKSEIKSSDSGESLDGNINPITGEIGITSMRRIIPIGTKTNTIGFRLVYNVPPPPESPAHKVEYGVLRLGARFWDGLKQTWNDLSPSYFAENASTASMNILNWTFGLIIPEAIQRYLKTWIGVRATPTTASLLEEAVVEEGAAATPAIEAAIEATAEAALLLPPPLDILIPGGLIVGGLVCAYYGKDIENAMAGFGITIDGLLNLFWRFR
ncbi:MAG: formylglycine-generating enzyme family protein [Chthoniobacterales bacterium]|nr:formylglycine-generating enzyme family protein [Chthoniobacterales bacterium]